MRKNLARSVAKRLLPSASYAKYEAWDQQRALRRGLNLLRGWDGEGAAPPFAFDDIVYGWGNPDCGAFADYAEACYCHALKAPGPVLECGSGLTTLILGVAAERTEHPVWTQEHHPEWGAKIQETLRSFGLSLVNVCVAPLTDYEGYGWYDPPLERMPKDIALVVCDGPPGQTEGGRYGMLPVMKDYLRDDAIVLLDDAGRPREQQALSRWAEDFGTVHTMHGDEKGWAIVHLTDASAEGPETTA